MIGFVFPCDLFDHKVPDEEFMQEYNMLKQAGFSVYLINIDNLNNTKIFPQLNNEELIYRGWMLIEEDYKKMDEKLNNQLKIKTTNYLHSHHLPNWYNSIKEYTIESIICKEEEAQQKYKNLNWNKAFIKDYVKSLKTGKGSIVDSEEDVQRALNDMKKYKGFIEGGIVLRKVTELLQNSEVRFFVLNNQVFSKEENKEMLQLAKKVANKHNEFFYSIDIAKDKNNNLYVIEIGDGQVSEAVGWNMERFINIFKSLNINQAKNFKI